MNMLKTLEVIKLAKDEGVTLSREEVGQLVLDLRELEKFREKQRLAKTTKIED